MKKHLLWVLMLCLTVLSSQLLFAQERTVTGTVSDNQGAPLSGANISVKNTNRVKVLIFLLILKPFY